jgi:hypothetical protein
VKEREWPKESDGRVKQGNGVSPSNVRGDIGGGSRSKEDAFVVVDNTIKRSREAVPKGPEAAGRIRT